MNDMFRDDHGQVCSMREWQALFDAMTEEDRYALWGGAEFEDKRLTPVHLTDGGEWEDDYFGPPHQRGNPTEENIMHYHDDYDDDFGPSRHAVLAVSCQHGIYAPQSFCELYGSQFIDADEEDIAIVLSGPEHPEYCEAWDNLTNHNILGTDGRQYYIFEDMDVWLEPVKTTEE